MPSDNLSVDSATAMTAGPDDASAVSPTSSHAGAHNEEYDADRHQPQESIAGQVAVGLASPIARVQIYENGYHFPPKYSWKETAGIAIKDLWKFYNTGFGFFLVMYSLNVVAWGGMLFLLLLSAAPQNMCPTGDCNAIDSPRRVWIEIDSQILNGLFCVTGFGLAPWRFRDLYYLMRYRIRKDHSALRRLAGVHRGWFRLDGSDKLPASLGPKNIEDMEGQYPVDSVPLPVETIPNPPPTGIRAPPTKLWKLDTIIWMNVANSLLQICLCYYMWHYNRIERPSWATGLFICLACIVGAVAGVMQGSDGKNVKSVEGVALSKRDRKRLARDRELGITHYNNYKDEDPAVTAEKKKARQTRKDRKKMADEEKAN